MERGLQFTHSDSCSILDQQMLMSAIAQRVQTMDECGRSIRVHQELNGVPTMRPNIAKPPQTDDGVLRLSGYPGAYSWPVEQLVS